MPTHFFSRIFLIFITLIALPFMSNASSMDDRVSRLENIIANQNQQLAQLNTMQSQIQELRGDVEILTNENSQLKQQQISYFSDLDQRLQNQENEINALPKPKGWAKKIHPISTENIATKPIITNTPVPIKTAGISTSAPLNTPVLGPLSAAPLITPAAPLVTNDVEAYQTAFNLIKTKQYTEALSAFKLFLTTYPDSIYIPNAHYWLGELYRVEQQNIDAKKEFALILEQYPQNPKVPDALLKIALIDYDQGNQKVALISLQKIISSYPGTTTANLAQAKLNSITK